MNLKMAIACLAIVGATHANAESHAAEEGAMAEVVTTGDAAKGEKVFRKCVSCHVVVNEAGETLAGKKAKTGPNLYGIAGGKFGEVEDFKFGDAALAAAGTVMDEEAFVAYVADPTGWLREVTGDSGARSKMSFKLKKEDDAKDVFAYLASLK
ncbi:c-type cytochrome [Actibacterium ureilyticum]|uniref:c-type cytochrome n=1 Tax=Actibacterium ureilyticum TaxID=1590614 RepID=UPI000BAAB941|nr:c-type cytochrome [Actibacterium ureilyticum]